MTQHQQLAGGAWKKLHFWEQMANIGSEVERTMKWRQKGNQIFADKAFERALELLSLTIAAHSQSETKMAELLRLEECLHDDFMFDNDYGSTDRAWHNYFFAFTYGASHRLSK